MRKLLLASLLGVVLAAGSGQGQPKPGEGEWKKVREDVHVYKAKTRPAQTATTRPARPAKTLEGARKLHWKGDYAAAAKAYRGLAKDPADAVRASVGLAESLAMVGKYDEALGALRAVGQRGRLDADWHIRQAEVLAAVGKYAEALKSARDACALRGDWAPAIFCLGQALETVGKKTEAIKVYESLEKALLVEGFTRDARSLTAAGKALDRHAILSGKKASEQAQNILHNYFQDAYQKVDKSYWPANVAAGMLLLEKYKRRQASQEFKLALKINKNLPDAYVGRGVILLGRYRFEQAIAEADKALKINPRHADALLVRAATYMMWRKFEKVAPELEKIFRFNPNHLEALATMAAVHVRKFQPEKAEPFIRRIEKVNPNYARVYETIGDWLSAGRQFDLAEGYYKKAMKMAPELAGPVTGLGRLYMQTGREELARTTLEKAFAIDDYRADVLNYLKLLRAMKKFSVKETEHFILKVDGKHDEVLLDWLADAAEKIHVDVTRDFEYTPKTKTLVEMFPNHNQFSVRISGRGWIGTVGACTGRVIAMPAPDPLRGGFGQFNWAVVLRHEYTHTVTLAATRNRIPHWFTEACAVWEQPDRRNFQAVALLVNAVRRNKLYPVKELSWGFIRPDRTRGRGARSLAYAQSEWIFEYIDEKNGRQAIHKMIRSFREGWTQQRIFKEVLGTTEARFDKDFRAWAKKQIRSWGFDPDPPPKLADAAKAAKEKPESADAQAALAVAQYNARRRKQAEDAARKALKIEPRHKRALAVLGTVLAGKKKYDDAIETALILEKVDPKSWRAAKILAQAYAGKRQWTNAIPALEKYKKLLPLDPYGHRELAKIWTQLGRHSEALPNLIEMHRRTMKDPKYARQVADIYRLANEPGKALEFYEQVIHINPYDTGAYKSMAALYLRTNAHDRAIRAMRCASLLEPKNAETWAQLAMVYFRAARAEKNSDRLSDARAAVEKSLEIDPEGQGKEVLQMIDQAGKL